MEPWGSGHSSSRGWRLWWPAVALKADDGRRFRAIRFYPGDNAYGAIFKTGTVDTAAMFGDDDIFVCHE